MARQISPLDRYAFQVWQAAKTKSGQEDAKLLKLLDLIEKYKDKTAQIVYKRRVMFDESWPEIISHLSYVHGIRICERTARRKYKKMIEYIRSQVWKKQP